MREAGSLLFIVSSYEVVDEGMGSWWRVVGKLVRMKCPTTSPLQTESKARMFHVQT